MLRNTLSAVFTRADLERVFKDYLWDALRKQPCQDLIGYYDYRLSISDRYERLTATIVSGNYRPKASLPILIARSDLLARNMHIPHPDDALVLQTISEALLPAVRKSQPSENAFFSRSHAQPKGIHNLEQESLYPWFALWPRYQDKILKFARVRKYLVITDIQSFFDSVAFEYIRRNLSEVLGKPEVIDLLLLLFENFIRRDMYAPVHLRGIPTIDMDAPRLVAHALLFLVDDYLKEKTGDCFARWVDDINFGVDSISDARLIIREIDSRLKKVGLRLGGGKTKILSFEEAQDYLEQEANQNLNILDTRLKKGEKATSAQLERLIREFRSLHKQRRPGHWDKVIRRYYKMIGRVIRDGTRITQKASAGIKQIEKTSLIDFDEYTSSDYRDAVIRFWSSLKLNDSRIERFVSAFEDVCGYDDLITYRLGETLAHSTISKETARDIVRRLFKMVRGSRGSGAFFGAACFLAVHGLQREIVNFINSTESEWEGNYFYARQAMGLWSLLRPDNRASYLLKITFKAKPDPDIAACLSYFEMLRELDTPPKRLAGYLPTNKQLKVVDLRRAIMIKNVLYSNNLDESYKEKLILATREKALNPLIQQVALGLRE